MKKSENKNRESRFKIRYIVYFVLLLLYTLAICSHSAHDIAIIDGGVTGRIHNFIGPAGAWISKWSFYLFGVTVYPLVVILYISLLRSFFLPKPERSGYIWALLSLLLGMTVIFV